MTQIKKIVLAFGLIGLTFSATQALAWGGLFVEPMLTYQALDTDTTFPAPFSNSTGSVNGGGLGARLGAHIDEAIFLALDARYMKPKYKDSSNNLSADASEFNYGLVAGAQMPIIGLRVWATWIAGGELDPASTNGVDLKFTQGKGYRVGAGFQLIIVSLNLEYQNLKYGSTTLENAGSLTSDDINLTEKGYIASISFPLEF